MKTKWITVIVPSMIMASSAFAQIGAGAGAGPSAGSPAGSAAAGNVPSSPGPGVGNPGTAPLPGAPNGTLPSTNTGWTGSSTGAGEPMNSTTESRRSTGYETSKDSRLNQNPSATPASTPSDTFGTGR